MLPRQSVLRSAARHCSTRGTPVVGVLGAGQMGGGIAQVAAVQAGCKVVLVDVKQEQLDKCMGLMDKLLAKDVAKDRLTEADKAAALARITTSTDMSAFGGASFLIEAATENVGLKLDLFRAMDSVAPSGAILASNTSSISITKMAAATARPEAVIGMHFMNPVPVMKLVEVIPGLATSEATLADTLALATAMGKTCTQSRDIPGFIANRILMPYINEAVQTLYEGIGTVEAIDTSMKLGTNVPMGPLTLADFIGLDTCLAIMQARPPLRTDTHVIVICRDRPEGVGGGRLQPRGTVLCPNSLLVRPLSTHPRLTAPRLQVLHSELGDSKYRPSPLLVQHVNAGWLGKKSGRGFYDYRK